MKKTFFAAVLSGAALVLSAGIASASVTPLSVTCASAVNGASVTWTASTAGGVAPVALMWGNGGTTSPLTLSYAPGTQSMTVQATDASSTVATSTCSAIVAAPVSPSITTFTATPSTLTLGQSAVLAWVVSNASSTSLDQGIGAVSSTSLTVSPTVTTTYTLTATNPNGSVTGHVTVTVGTSTSSSVADQIRALLAQIAALQAQLQQLIAGATGGGTQNPGTTPPGQVGKTLCISLTRNLHRGDRGDDVMKLQQWLGITPTGFFGGLTSGAMQQLQAQNGLASSTDGSVGPLTRGFFNRSCGKGLSKHGNDEGGNASSTSSNTSTTGNHDGGGEDNGSGHGKSHGN